MIRKAEKVVVLADNTKFGSGSLLTSAQPEDVDVVITDRRANPAMVEALRGRGVQVELVDGE
jgi:DeoR/GlpR family transcriptional regulator of sugar metabolism